MTILFKRLGSFILSLALIASVINTYGTASEVHAEGGTIVIDSLELSFDYDAIDLNGDIPYYWGSSDPYSGTLKINTEGATVTRETWYYDSELSEEARGSFVDGKHYYIGYTIVLESGYEFYIDDSGTAVQNSIINSLSSVSENVQIKEFYLRVVSFLIDLGTYQDIVAAKNSQSGGSGGSGGSGDAVVETIDGVTFTFTDNTKKKVKVNGTLPEIDSGFKYVYQIFYSDGESNASNSISWWESKINKPVTEAFQVNVSNLNASSEVEIQIPEGKDTVVVLLSKVKENSDRTVYDEEANPIEAYNTYAFAIGIVKEASGGSTDPVPPVATSSDLYSVTVTNGTVDGTNRSAEYEKDATVTIIADEAPEGQEFNKWDVTTNNVTLANEESTTTTFTMPAEVVKVEATYKTVAQKVEWIDAESSYIYFEDNDEYYFSVTIPDDVYEEAIENEHEFVLVKGNTCLPYTAKKNYDEEKNLIENGEVEVNNKQSYADFEKFYGSTYSFYYVQPNTLYYVLEVGNLIENNWPLSYDIYKEGIVYTGNLPEEIPTEKVTIDTIEITIQPTIGSLIPYDYDKIDVLINGNKNKDTYQLYLDWDFDVDGDYFQAMNTYTLYSELLVDSVYYELLDTAIVKLNGDTEYCEVSDGIAQCEREFDLSWDEKDNNSAPNGSLQLDNNGYPNGKSINLNSAILRMPLKSGTADSYQWQMATEKDGTFVDIEGAINQTLKLDGPEHSAWYRCVATKGTTALTSKAIQLLNPAEDERTWTRPASAWYFSNGKMAYTTTGSRFDVVGLYTIKETDYMIQTSYSGGSDAWSMQSSSLGAPEAVHHWEDINGLALDAFRVSFDDNDAYRVNFEADLKEGQKSFVISTDTQLGDSNTSGDYADYAALSAIVSPSGKLNSILMVGAETIADAEPTAPAIVITPKKASTFWIGDYWDREHYAYNTVGEADEYTTLIGDKNVVTTVEGEDSGLSISWMNVEDGIVRFSFGVGSVEDTGAGEIADPDLTPKFEVTVNSGTADDYEYAEGDEVTITANAAPEGKVFDKWIVTSGNIELADATSATTTFTMPAEVVTVTATYKDASGETDPDTEPTPDPDPVYPTRPNTKPDEDKTASDILNESNTKVEEVISSGSKQEVTEIVDAALKTKYFEIIVNEYEGTRKVESAKEVDATLGDVESAVSAILTQEELANAATGKDTTQIILDVVSDKEVTTEEKNSIMYALSAGHQIGEILDVSLYKVINSDKQYVSETNGEIEITIELSEAMREKENLGIIRTHINEDGSVESVVLRSRNNGDGTLTFWTDKFSTYTITYSELDLSAYSNFGLNVYENSRVTHINRGYNNFVVNGYMWIDGITPSSATWREIIFVNAEDVDTSKAYRKSVKPVRNTFLNSNLTATKNGKIDLSYAFYSVEVNPAMMQSYDKKSVGKMASGTYYMYMRISDGKDSYLFPLIDRVLSDGTTMESKGILPEGFKVADADTRTLVYTVK